MHNSFLNTLNRARHVEPFCSGQGGVVVGPSTVLKSDPGEKDVIIGRQHGEGCQSPSTVLGGGPAQGIRYQVG